jgi:hypothetical protein
MARPRIIRTADGGEVVVKNCTLETFEAVNSALNPGHTEVAEVEKPAVVDNFTHTALGTFKKDGRDWCIVYIKYDPLTKEAFVDSVDEVGPDRGYAREKFKIEVINKGIL